MRVAALGGHALLPRGASFDLDLQRNQAALAARALAPLALDEGLVVTHGNGPQVGFLAEHTGHTHPARFDLDVLGAESEGLVGFLLETALRNAIPERQFATLLTQTEVDPRDPAFATPEKPIGPALDAEQAAKLRETPGLSVAAQGAVWRRVVPSPMPRAILQIEAIRSLASDRMIPICAGGGGIPVVRGPDGDWRGIDAVVDKDATAALLARALGADTLLLLTDVDAVYDGWGGEAPVAIPRATPTELRTRTFEAGSMGPKVAAACEFATGHRRAWIGALPDVGERACRGTWIGERET